MKFDHLKRRDVITLLGGAAAAWPLATRAQQAGKLPTIGFLDGATPWIESQRLAAFVQRLRELAWVDGRNVAIESRWAEGRPERVSEIAAEFVPPRTGRIALKPYLTPSDCDSAQFHQKGSAHTRACGQRRPLPGQGQQRAAGICQ